MSILLIVLGIILILINYRALKKDKKSNFNDIYNNADKLTKDYDFELMAIRKDMAESILDLQKEIEELKNVINYSKDIKNINKSSDIVIDNNITTKDITEEKISENDNDKVTKIKSMIVDGYTDEEICNKMQIGKGEVLLIRGLFK